MKNHPSTHVSSRGQTTKYPYPYADQSTSILILRNSFEKIESRHTLVHVDSQPGMAMPIYRGRNGGRKGSGAFHKYNIGILYIQL